MSTLNVNIKETSSGRYFISLSGKLDTETYGKLDSSIVQIFETPVSTITFDMNELEFISSMGLRVFMETEKKLREQKGQLLITNASPSITKVLEIAKALPSMNIFASLAEADQYLTNMQKNV